MKIQTAFLIPLLISIMVSQWPTDPSELLEVSSWGLNHESCTDGTGGVYMAWQNFSDTRRIYLQRVDRYGYVQWPSPVFFGGEGDGEWYPELVEDGLSNVYVSYYEVFAVDTIEIVVIYDKKAMVNKVDTTGTLLWGGPVRVSLDSTYQVPMMVSTDGEDGLTVIFKENDTWFPYADEWRIKMQKISPDGERLLGDSGILLYAEDIEHMDASVFPDGLGGAIVYKDYQTHICQRFNSAGEYLWGDDIYGIPFEFVSTVKIIPDGTGGAIITGELLRDDLTRDYLIQRISATGELLWGDEGVIFADSVSSSSSVIFITFRSDSVTVINWMTDGNHTVRENLLQMVGYNGEIYFENGGIPPSLIEGTGIFTFGQVLNNDNSLITCFGYRPQDNYMILVQKASPIGEYLWENTGLIIDTTVANFSAKIIPDQNGGVIYTVEDPPVWGIFAQQMSANGNLGEVLPFVSVQGDINHDGEMDILDIIICVDIILEHYMPDIYELTAADMNTDDIIDILDIVLMVNSILAG